MSASVKFRGRKRRVTIQILLASLFTALTLLVLVDPARVATNAEALDLAVSANSDPIALGSAIDGFPGAGSGTSEALDRFAADIGTPAFITWYQDWGNSSGSGFLKEHFVLIDSYNARSERPVTPMLSWSPENHHPEYGNLVDQPAYKLTKIANGEYDGYVSQTARDMRDYNKPIYLRFAHEMNGDWYPWGVGVNCDPDGSNCNKPEDYVAAWRHVHDIFVREGATNVRWVWSPGVVQEGRASYASLYPGDDYVDWVALDGYNWGWHEDENGNRNEDWRSFSQVFCDSYREIYGFTSSACGSNLVVPKLPLTSKPMMIGETASAEDPWGDPKRKAEWITDAYFSALPRYFPNVKAVLWYHVNRESEDGERNWLIDTSSESLSAYKRVASESKYQGTLP